MSGKIEELEKLTDDELIERLRDGDDSVTDFICDKYKDLVRKNAKSMFILGADKDDLIQEGMIGLFKAVRDYDPGRDASFYTFADLCISRQMYTAVRASQRKKHQPLNSYISLDGGNGSGEQEDGETVTLGGILSDHIGVNPEEIVMDAESYRELDEMITEQLSDFERQVLDLHLVGMNYVAIAKLLGRSDKATDNALQRLKSKIKKIVTSKNEEK